MEAGPRTALHCAAQSGHLEVVQMLLAARADIDAQWLVASRSWDFRTFWHLNGTWPVFSFTRRDPFVETGASESVAHQYQSRLRTLLVERGPTYREARLA